jgi:hypothetical protein
MSVASVSASFPAMKPHARNGESSVSSCENFTFHGHTSWEMRRYARFELSLGTGRRTLNAPTSSADDRSPCWAGTVLLGRRGEGMGAGSVAAFCPSASLQSACPWHCILTSEGIVFARVPRRIRPRLSLMPYRPRIVDPELSARLAATGAVVIEGPKGCGKTATARQLARSEVLLDVDENARRAIAIDPSLVLDGPVPRLFDEWQLEPTLWNHLRRAVDARQQPGQFILTGSAAPTDDITRHTGAARITRLRMRPMSLFETGHSTGAISLAALLAGEPARSPESTLTVTDLATLVVIGGWPGNLTRTSAQAMQASRDYLDEIRRVPARWGGCCVHSHGTWQRRRASRR